MLVETLIDAVLGIVILVFALTQHVLPRVPELPSIPAFEWSWAVANPTITAIIATFILLAGMLALRRVKAAGRAFAARVRQGFTILRKPRRYFLRSPCRSWSAGAAASAPPPRSSRRSASRARCATRCS